MKTAQMNLDAAFENARRSVLERLLHKQRDIRIGELLAVEPTRTLIRGVTLRELALLAGARGGRWDDKQAPAVLDAAGRRRVIAGPSAHRGVEIDLRDPSRRESYDAQILQAVRRLGPVGSGQLAEGVGGSAAQIRGALQRLEAEGRVRRSGSTRWTVYTAV